MTWRYASQAASVLALDLNEGQIDLATQNTPEELRSKVRFIVADITDPKLELPQEAFEVAILSHSL
jgi:ubiquinone/menaquinone biosynthesis C-methylase UbiE